MKECFWPISLLTVATILLVSVAIVVVPPSPLAGHLSIAKRFAFLHELLVRLERIGKSDLCVVCRAPPAAQLLSLVLLWLANFFNACRTFTESCCCCCCYCCYCFIFIAAVGKTKRGNKTNNRYALMWKRMSIHCGHGWQWLPNNPFCCIAPSAASFALRISGCWRSVNIVLQRYE